MNPDEAMAEIREWLDDDSSRRLGELWRVDEWLLETKAVYGEPVEDEVARRYITGWLQEWYADNYEMVDKYTYELASRISKQAEDGEPTERGLVPMIDMYDDRGFLPALWLAYKAVEKIKVADGKEN